MSEDNLSVRLGIPQGMRLIPRNWSSLQHYRDRRPPWIKLHRDLLDDRVFASLPVEARALFPMLLLIASEDASGVLADDIPWRLRIGIKEAFAGLKPLIDHGFMTAASGVLAECKQDARERRDREEDRREDSAPVEHVTNSKPRQQAVAKPDDVPQQVWDDWLVLRKAKKAPVTETALKRLRSEAERAGLSLSGAMEICAQNGWQGLQAGWIKRNPDSKSHQPQQDRHRSEFSLGDKRCSCLSCRAWRRDNG